MGEVITLMCLIVDEEHSRSKSKGSWRFMHTTWTRLWSISFAFVKIIKFIMAVLHCWLTHKATSWPVLITEKSQVMIRIQFPQPPKPRIAAIGLLSCLDYLNISFTPLTRQESTKVKKIDGNDPVVAVLSKNSVIINNKVRFHRHGWAWAWAPKFATSVPRVLEQVEQWYMQNDRSQEESPVIGHRWRHFLIPKILTASVGIKHTKRGHANWQWQLTLVV